MKLNNSIKKYKYSIQEINIPINGVFIIKLKKKNISPLVSTLAKSKKFRESLYKKKEDDAIESLELHQI